MVRDAVRGYWALATGLTEVTRQRAMAAAKALVAQGEATAEQVGSLAEDLLSTSVANRDALLGVVQHEIDRARTAVGVVTAADLDALRSRVDALTAEVAALRASAATSTGDTTASGPKQPAPPAKATAKKATPTQAVAKKTTAKKAAATKTTGERPAKKTSGEQPVKETAKKAAAKKTATSSATTARARQAAAEVTDAGGGGSPS